MYGAVVNNSTITKFSLSTMLKKIPLEIPTLQSLDHSKLYCRRARSRNNLDDENDYDNVHSATDEDEEETKYKQILRHPEKLDQVKSENPKCVGSVNGYEKFIALIINIIYYRITGGMSLDSMVCSRCSDGFEPHEKIVNSTGELWHQQCFV